MVMHSFKCLLTRVLLAFSYLGNYLQDKWKNLSWRFEDSFSLLARIEGNCWRIYSIILSWLNGINRPAIASSGPVETESME